MLQFILSILSWLFSFHKSDAERLGVEKTKNEYLNAALKEKTDEAKAYKEYPRSRYAISSAWDRLRDSRKQ